MRSLPPSFEPAVVATSESREEVLRDGTEVLIRPIHRSDIELERRFIEALSPRSRRFRFLDTMSSPSSALLRKLVEPDPAKDAAYVAIIHVNGQPCEIGVARFSAVAGGDDCEFAVTVSDAWQRQGLGTLLMARLIEIARTREIETMHSSDSWDNDLMRRFGEHCTSVASAIPTTPRNCSTSWTWRPRRRPMRPRCGDAAHRSARLRRQPIARSTIAWASPKIPSRWSAPWKLSA